MKTATDLSRDSLYARFGAFTLLSPGKFANLRRLAAQVNARGVPGAFVECGVANGGSAALLATLAGERELWLFDSFQGMPPPEAIDGAQAAEYVGLCRGHESEVRRLVAETGLSPEKTHFEVGLFAETFRHPLPEQIALLHCDADWYASVLLVLETFHPRLAEGGVVVLDDFDCWEGCREAFYDFCFRAGEKPLLERLEYDQAWWIKGRRHNR